MHPSDLHRVRVLTPETGAGHAAPLAAPSPQLSRQAALFEKYRQLAANAEQQAASESARDEAQQSGEPSASASESEAALHERHAPALCGMHPARHGGTMPAAFASQGTVAALADALERDTPQGGGEDSSGQQDGSGKDRQDSHGGDKRDNGAEAPASAASNAGLSATLSAGSTAKPNTAPGAHPMAGSNPATNARSGTDLNAGHGTEPGQFAASGRFAAPVGTSATTPSPRVTALARAASVTQTGDAPPRLVDYLLSQAAEFCSNPAVLARGNWQMTIGLDPQQLPECNLHLSLSYFDLALRFETAHPESRQLISVHRPTLHERLAALLKQAAPDTPRNIEITVS